MAAPTVELTAALAGTDRLTVVQVRATTAAPTVELTAAQGLTEAPTAVPMAEQTADRH